MNNLLDDNIDLLVGIPSFNNARTIGHVVSAVQAGLAKYFPERRALIVNSDGGSNDGTTEIVRNTIVRDPRSLLIRHEAGQQFRLTVPYNGVPGKGSAFRKIFEMADRLNVTACAVVDSDLRSITPEWIELLLKPVVEGGFDFVAPLYKRHKYDGTITNGIIYPLTRALYGLRVRQPIGGEFGFSGNLARFYLGKDVWDSDVARFGIDIWMTTTAIANRFRVCQSYLGAKIHDPKDPASDLSDMLCQVVGSAFDLMETYPREWAEVLGSVPVPCFGFEYAVGLEPIDVNLDKMLLRFRLGVRELLDIWKTFLPKAIISLLLKLEALPADRFHLCDEAWSEIIYGFALAFHRRTLTRQHLLKSLTPLYIGRTASFVIDTRECGADEVEQRIEGLCGVFEDRKAVLKDNWH